MRQLRIRRIARAEIFEAFNWYLVRSPRAAAGFIEAADAAIRGIEEEPELHGPIHGSRHPDTWLHRAEP